MKNKLLTILLLLIPVFSVFAQVPPPPDQGEDAGMPGWEETPIDQYVFVLIALVAVFAVYYVWKQRNLVKI